MIMLYLIMLSDSTKDINGYNGCNKAKCNNVIRIPERVAIEHATLIGQFKIKISDWLIEGKNSKHRSLWAIAPCPNKPFPRNIVVLD